MPECAICQHAKRDVIEAKVARGIYAGVVARQFRVNPEDLAAHMTHGSTASALEKPTTTAERAYRQVGQETDESALQKVAEHDFRRGWQHMDTQARQRNLSWLPGPTARPQLGYVSYAMSYLSHLRFTKDRVDYEAVSFYGPSLDAADAEMRQWLLRTLPIGSCVVQLHLAHQTDGHQHRIDVTYHAAQDELDRVEPKGLFSEHDFS